MIKFELIIYLWFWILIYLTTRFNKYLNLVLHEYENDTCWSFKYVFSDQDDEDDKGNFLEPPQSREFRSKSVDNMFPVVFDDNGKSKKCIKCGHEYTNKGE